MKKGLLSLLAVALTIVSCQNYDDQFAELTTLVNSLSTDVEQLSQVQTQILAIGTDVDAVQSTVDNLAAAVATITSDVSELGDVPDDLTDLAAALATAQGNITTIQDAVAAAAADSSVTSQTLADLTSALSDVQDDVTELLQADSVVNQNISINNVATLLYAASLISTQTGDDAGPNVIVNGFVDIDTQSFSPAITTTQLADVKAIAGKIATILGSATANKGLNVNTNAANKLDFSALSFVDHDVVINGSAQTIGALGTISGDLTTNYAGEAVFSTPLSSVGTVTISNAASTSIVNFAGVTVANFVTGTASAGDLTFATATDVNLGTAKFHSLDAPKALNVNSDMTAATGNVSVTAQLASLIDLSDLETIAGDLTVTATGTTDVDLSDLSSVATITVSNSADAHFDSLASATGSITITATGDTDLTALTAINKNSSIGGTTVLLPALAKTLAASGTLTLPKATALNAPLLVNGSTLTAPEALEATLKSSTQANLVLAKATELTLSSLTVSFTAANTDYPKLATLNASGKSSAQNGVTGVEIDVTSTATLTTVNLTGKFNAATVSGTGITDLTTDGYITDLTIQNTDIDALDLNHSFVGLDTAPTVDINNNAELISIDLAGVKKLKTITITSNASLTTIVPPSTTGARSDIYAEDGATITVSITGTSELAATYTEGVTGTIVTQTVPAQDAEAATLAPSTASGIESLLDWYEAAALSTVGSNVQVEFKKITYVDRVRDTTDGSIANTTSTTLYTTFESAEAQDPYSSVLGLSSGLTGIDTDDELAIVVRD